jgi:hypothetical protein
MPDFVRLDATLAYTEAHPETHDQSVWARPIFADNRQASICGTACCFAGNALVVEGYQFEWRYSEWEPGRGILDAAGNPVEFDGRDATESDIMYLAEDLLGLDKGQSARLFSAFNTVANLRAIIDHWRSEAEAEGVES